jgi:hypothetical protein
MKDEELLDRLKEKFGCTSDRQLANVLAVTPTFISLVRHKRKELSLKVKLRAFDKLGYSLARDTLLLLTPGKVRSALLERDNERASKKSSGELDPLQDLSITVRQLKTEYPAEVILKTVTDSLF